MITKLQNIRNKINYSADQSFDNDFLEGVRRRRINYIKAAQENDFKDGLENLLTRLYPDNAHFVYELLQNAEDADATKVYFCLQEDCLYFLHNGSKEFSVKDVDSITSISKSQKLEDVNKIGKFGVGFKSVFSYTSTPSVHSSKISFLIKDMLLPSKLIAEEVPDQYTTLFIFPFNCPDKPKKQAYEEVLRLFKKLSNNTLLFLSGIKEINWAFDEQNSNSIKRKNRGDYIEICSTSEDSSYWYVFTKNIHIDTNNENGNFDVKIAYAFDQDNKTIIETRGGVSIFFPADSEVSELKFHIHAPFASTVARDSLVKDNAENQQLIQGIAELCCESFYELKDNKLLDTSFFAVLPNYDDGLNDTYLPIYERIIDEFESESNDLIPIGNNIFSSLKNCRFTRASIKNIFDKVDLRVLLGNEDIKGFAINASQKNNRTDRFLNSLNQITFNEYDLIDCLKELDIDVSDEEMEYAIYDEDDERIEEINLKREWLESKSNKWLQSLYALLFDFSEQWSIYGDVSDLTSIIKLSDGSFNFSKDSVYFSDSDQYDSNFNFVNRATYLSGKKEKQKQRSKEFLEYIGVQNLDESTHIKILFQNYEFESENQHIKDINRLVQFYVDENYIDSKFKYFSFIYTNQKNILSPNEVAIDSPYEETGLQYVLHYQDKELLNPLYQKIDNTNKFIELLKSLDAIDTLEISETTIEENPERELILKNAKGSRWTYTAINRDWHIKHLKGMLADKKHKREISKLVWNTMCAINYNSCFFEAQYRWNSSYATSTSKSQLIHTLSNLSWIPDKEGKFHNPKDIDKDSLPQDFIYNNDNEWLDQIDFGLNVQFTKDDQEKAEDLVKAKTGHSIDQLERLFNNFSEEEIRQLNDKKENEKNERLRLRDAMRENQGSGKTNEKDITGPVDEIITDEDKLQDSISHENEGVNISTKSSTTTKNRQNPEELNKVKSFLYKQYKGHCQICGDTFKRSNSKHYYKVFSINRGEGRDVNRKGNTLCLCPKHHAIFSEKLHNFSFINELPKQDLTIGKIRERFNFRGGVGKGDVVNKNDGFFALDEDDYFEIDAFLLPIKIFNQKFFLKFTQEHLQNFIEVYNNN